MAISDFCKTVARHFIDAVGIGLGAAATAAVAVYPMYLVYNNADVPLNSPNPLISRVSRLIAAGSPLYIGRLLYPLYENWSHIRSGIHNKLFGDGVHFRALTFSYPAKGKIKAKKISGITKEYREKNEGFDETVSSSFFWRTNTANRYVIQSPSYSLKIAQLKPISYQDLNRHFDRLPQKEGIWQLLLKSPKTDWLCLKAPQKIFRKILKNGNVFPKEAPASLIKELDKRLLRDPLEGIREEPLHLEPIQPPRRLPVPRIQPQHRPRLQQQY